MKSSSIKLSFGGAVAIVAVTSIIVGLVYIKNVNDAPVASLKDYKPAHDYGQAYWTQEKNADSKRWEEAIAYCNTYRTKTPGCFEVEGAYTGIDMSKLPDHMKFY